MSSIKPDPSSLLETNHQQSNYNKERRIKKRFPRWLIIAIIGFLGSASGYLVFFRHDGNTQEITNSHATSSLQQQNNGGNSVTQPVGITGDVGSLVLDGKVMGAESGPSLHRSDFTDNENWIIDKGLIKEETKITYKKNGKTATPQLMLTKEKYSQHAEVVISFVPLTEAINLHFRLANIFDLRFGDGGNSEVALGPYSNDANWPSIDLDNPNCERKNRHCLPCRVAIGKVVTLRIVIDAPEEYRDRKSVTLFSDYYCEDGKHVDSQDASVRAPFWSFQVPSSINEPVQYGIGLDDPTGKDKPAVELKQIKIIPH